MRQNQTSVSMLPSDKKQHSPQLQESLSSAAKSLSGRPLGLRGPFLIQVNPNKEKGGS